MDDSRRAEEHALVLRCQLGDADAFRDLVARCDRPLRYYIRRLVSDEAEAADVAQDVWLEVFRRIARLDHPEAFRGWMYRIAHNLVVTRLRKRTARQRAEEMYAGEGADEVELPMDRIDAAHLHRAIERLDEVHREVMLLALVGDLTVVEMATALGVPAGTVKSRMHQARRQLRDWLGGSHD
jgi:RNA polymerase sigma-70 factor (ECF subfamily)